MNIGPNSKLAEARNTKKQLLRSNSRRSKGGKSSKGSKISIGTGEELGTPATQKSKRKSANSSVSGNHMDGGQVLKRNKQNFE